MLERTKFLLDDFEDFLLVKLLGEALDGCQSLTTIALYEIMSQPAYQLIMKQHTVPRIEVHDKIYGFLYLRWIRMWM